MGNRGETTPVGFGGDADQLQFITVRRDYTEGIFTDGAGGSEKYDAFAHGGGRLRRNCP
jgi:hypothetical protein